MIERIEQTLNGGFNGLYGEVVSADCYKLKQLKFIPQIIFDLGANVGVFTRFARSLFPHALIVAVEPDKENFEHLAKFTPQDDRIILLNMAIGNGGSVFRIDGAINGAHESYISDGIVGFDVKIKKVDVSTTTVINLIDIYLEPEYKSVLKLDIEGAEISIWNHPHSMEALKQIDYFTGEIHYTMLEGNEAERSKQKSLAALHTFDETHNVVIAGTSFWLTKK